MPRKKAAPKKALGTKRAKKAVVPVKPAPAPVAKPAPKPAPAEAGRVRSPRGDYLWELYEGRLVVTGQDLNFTAVFPEALKEVECSLNGSPIGPKVAGNCLQVRCGSGTFEARFRYAVPPALEINYNG